MNIDARRPLVIQAEATVSAVASDPVGGRRQADALIDTARTAGDDEALVVAMRAAGYAARELYQHDDAQRLLDEAATIARAAQLPARLCEVLITRSAMHIELGHPRRARRDLEEAGAVADDIQLSEVDFAVGLLADTTGDFAAAAAAYQRSLRRRDGVQDLVRVKTLNNLALIVARFGRYEEADRLLEQAIAIAAQRWRAREGIATESYALVAVDSGRPVEALRRYARAELLLTELGVQLADLYIGKARALLTLMLLDEAADAADRAVAVVAHRSGGSMMLAEALLPHARIALAQGRHADAAAAATRAEDLFRRQRRSGWRAVAALLRASAEARSDPVAATATRLDHIERTMAKIGNVPGIVEAALLQGELSAALGRRRKAALAFGRAATAASGPVLVRIQGRIAAARRAELEGNTRRLAQICRLGLDELASYRATVASAELRARVAAHGTALAQIGLAAALRSERAEQVWSWIERSSSVVFIGGAQPTSDELMRPHLAQLRALESELGAVPPDDAATRATMLRRITRLERRIRSVSWTRAGGDEGWVRPSVGNLRRLRDDLGGRVLLQYGASGDRLCAVAVTTDRLLRADIGSVVDVVALGRQLAFALRRLTQSHSSREARALAMEAARDDLHRLAAVLVGPLAPVVAQGDEVIVAPPGELIGIPWGSLEPIADRPVRVVPSAISWWLSSRRGPVSDRRVLVAGPDLAAAEDEVQLIADRYEAATTIVGEQSVTETVRRQAAGAAMVHIAAHGRLRTDNPTFSSIHLNDGPLTVHDLETVEPPAHHWILAACDLGRPGPLAGPALEGVLAALLAGGAGAVVAATASVPDLDTRELMVELHGCLAAGRSLPEALRSARNAVDMSDPTGFVAGVAFTCYGGG